MVVKLKMNLKAPLEAFCDRDGGCHDGGGGSHRAGGRHRDLVVLQGRRSHVGKAKIERSCKT